MIKNFCLLLIVITPIVDLKSQGYGGSDECNVNVICEPDWCNQRRSVGLIFKLIDGVYERSSTGFLLTNERRDGRPYFMTANHIIDSDHDGSISADEQEVIDNLRVVFNYQAGNCLPNTPTIEPSTNSYVIDGTTLIAHHQISGGGDWALLELSERPAGNFNAYYNGWDTDDSRPEDGALIHHSSGDIKKISMYEGKATKHPNLWETDWSVGRADLGSSGGPFYDDAKLVRGQQSSLSENSTECDEVKSFMGRFDIAWDENAATDRQLKTWLNPHGTETNSIILMSGDEEHCKVLWSFSNANDLHTSINVNGQGFPNNAGSRMYDGHYEATIEINAENNVNILAGTTVDFNAGNRVVLKPGFHAHEGSNFRAHIGGCIRGCNTGVGKNGIGFGVEDNYMLVGNSQKSSESTDNLRDLVATQDILLFPNPTFGKLTLKFKDTKTEERKIDISNMLGTIVLRSTSKNNIIDFSIEDEPRGIYIIQVTESDRTIYFKLWLK